VNSALEAMKGKLFSASVRCPKCGTMIKMRVSDNKTYAYQCLDCDEDFYSFECPETVSDYQNKQGEIVPLYKITLYGQSANWFKSRKDALDDLCAKYNVAFWNAIAGASKAPMTKFLSTSDGKLMTHKKHQTLRRYSVSRMKY